jgi:hypothetical protein
MEYKVKQIVIVEEQNELGNLFLEKLIERMVLEELDLPSPLSAIVLSKQQNKGVSNDE